MNPTKEIAAEAARWWRNKLENATERVPTEKALNKFERWLKKFIRQYLKKKGKVILQSDHGEVCGLLFWSANVAEIPTYIFPANSRMVITIEDGIKIENQ